MYDSEDSPLYKLWFLVAVLLSAACLLLLSLRLSEGKATASSAKASVTKVSGVSQTVASAAAHSVLFVETVMQNGVAAVGNGLIGGVTAVIYGASHTVGSVSGAFVANSLTRPVSKAPVPVITSLAAAPVAHAERAPAAQASAPVAKPPETPPATPLPAPPQADPHWPIHGAITTAFGVPELPYERIHTGLDISDGKRAGTTPVRPFRPGHVTQTLRSSGGLGNHVIVDHGGGVTSVYGHLASISVQTGQPVDENTVLGFEGSTGASTGTHLHFEIRVNGQPVNPLNMISGRP